MYAYIRRTDTATSRVNALKVRFLALTCNVRDTGCGAAQMRLVMVTLFRSLRRQCGQVWATTNSIEDKQHQPTDADIHSQIFVSIKTKAR